LDCSLLKGGYKSFRQFVLSYFNNDFPFIVIGGLTGSGKTDALKALAEEGEQTLDLEAMAHHKGSAFGNLGEKKQHSTEHFENKICWALMPYDTRRSIWVEDESRNIGRNILPAGIFNQIRSSPVIYLDTPMADRVDRLVRDYAGFSADELGESIRKISQRLGGDITKKALDAVKRGDYRSTAEMVLHYYDKTYLFGLNKRDPQSVFRLPVIDSKNALSIARQILNLTRENPGYIRFK
jgi:tRNA 2-selenouridine synthase